MLGWDDKAGVSGSKSRKRKMSATPEKKTGAPPLPHRCSSALSSITNSERREIFVDVKDGGGAGGGYGGDAARFSSDGSLDGRIASSSSSSCRCSRATEASPHRGMKMMNKNYTIVTGSAILNSIVATNIYPVNKEF
jgi:hypothetical protein